MPRYNFLSSSLIISLALSANLAHGQQANCPSLAEIHRLPGQYHWQTELPGWEGKFFSPTSAKGESTEVTRFLQAQWVQYSNLPNSAGYIQCDYQGNHQNEVIRFTQSGNKSTKQPMSEAWGEVSSATIDFPSIQAVCVLSAQDCIFEQL